MTYLQKNSTETLQNLDVTEAIALGWGQMLLQCEPVTFSPDLVAIA